MPEQLGDDAFAVGGEPPIEIGAGTPRYYDGFGPAIVKDGMLHLVVWAWQPSVIVPGTMEKVTVDRLVTRVGRVDRQIATILDALRIAVEAHDDEPPGFQQIAAILDALRRSIETPSGEAPVHDQTQ